MTIETTSVQNFSRKKKNWNTENRVEHDFSKGAISAFRGAIVTILEIGGDFRLANIVSN